MNAVEIRDLTRRFGSFVAVDHVSLDVSEGEIFGFLGSNGAGKSTAIRMLCGLLKPSSGRATVLGIDVARVTPGVVKARFALCDELSCDSLGAFTRSLYWDAAGLADGYISANVHASVPGKIVEITEHPTVYSKRGMCVVIEAQGSFPTSGRPLESADWGSMSNLELLNRVAEAGVVGLGGAAFPTQVKLHPPRNRQIEALIINGSECEPYLTVDDMLMQTFPGKAVYLDLEGAPAGGFSFGGSDPSQGYEGTESLGDALEARFQQVRQGPWKTGKIRSVPCRMFR